MKKRICAAAVSLVLALGTISPAAALDLETGLKLIEDRFIDPLPDAAFQAETLEELLQSINDPYTVYYTAPEYDSFLSSVNGSSVTGIGVTIYREFNNGYEIGFVLANSPALEAGLQIGDRIQAVDGVLLTAEDDPAALIRGEAGTSITLTILRTDGTVRDYTMERRKVHIPIVEHQQMDTLGYIDCTSFGDTTMSATMTALTEMDRDTAVWAMDLRSNPGGAVVSAVGTTSLFVGPNIITYMSDNQGSILYYYTTDDTPDLTDKPLILLTSASSASGSELLASAIRDLGAGISIGDRTYGKGVAQTLLDESRYPDIFSGDALKITTSRYYSPRGTTNHIVGVIPTLLVPNDFVLPIAMLLSTPEPEQSFRYYKLELAGQTFYLHHDDIKESPLAFTQLLQALPPSAAVYRGAGRDMWEETTLERLVEKYRLDYRPRTFDDVENSPYSYEIDTLSTYFLISGTGENTFSPTDVMTRGEMASLLADALYLPPSEFSPAFSDVAGDSPYAQAISAVTARGFMKGISPSTFSPDAPITMMELVTLLDQIYIWSSLEGQLQSKEGLNAEEWLTFYPYPEWAQAPARNMAKLGMPVDPNAPHQEVTRELVAAMLCRLMEHLNLIWN